MDKVISQYQADENVMIQLFASWCAIHQLNASTLYAQAYPQQEKNLLLEKAIEEMDTDAVTVDTETLLNVLQLFGNEDLAFVVSEESEKLKKR
ncbi:hypothetical protein OR571_18585 [Psychrobacillus sp. NEAU-3TGS]|uniref:hypothetical protein n=1 Tax=Psychrobacillus sp. NEAU-3TGS TaxID=2995412 RepID=UPI002498970C|nr:hypothetical protein [Psychrobacillus sp. NEAU-3TGS]MDI2589047.1 hypothetical protein [Psychrobacillus sp. NEAU-3TGS]